MPFKKNFEVGLQTPLLPQTPYIAYKAKIENLNFILVVVRMYSN